ncbi:ATP-binding protein [Rummeliibacillus suwonensis]|uniref:ATP-binding protein n=1 Tax=Rummeliibacillus suwonensis TaxID=1306154 RepID=UPI00289E71A7|nr:ATP-binding protein [Rummeliibacillus suwonensis]
MKEFNLSDQTSISRCQLDQLKEMNWLEQLFNLILLGPPSIGKTHMAIGLGIEAIQKGFQVTFVTMGD